MKLLVPAIDQNALNFSGSIIGEIDAAWIERLAKNDIYRDAYRRVVSLQAWRVRVIEPHNPGIAASMLLEAQNDALMSLVLAHLAMWRPALQCLRSCIESVLNTCYYADHPIEAQLWERGDHRMGFSEQISYFEKHPADIPRYFPSMLGRLRSEYSVLSKAVHGSARSFQMTQTGNVTLTNSDDAEHSKWATRHRSVLLCVNLLLVALYHRSLTGTQQRDLRKAISLAIPDHYQNDIFQNLKVRLFSIP